MFELHAGLVAGESILFTRQIGIQTARALENEVARLALLIKEHPVLDEIVDLSRVEHTDFDFHSIRRLVRITCQNAKPEDGPKRIALYAPHDTLYGVGRIYGSLMDFDDGKVRAGVFRAQDELLEWMDRPERSFDTLEGYANVGPLPELPSACCQ